MKFCNACLNNALRQWPIVDLVTDSQLRNPAYLHDMRVFTASLDISPDDWPDFICDLYRDFRGLVVDQEGHTIGLNTDLLDTYREWYRDWANKPVVPGIMPRLRKEAKARIRVIATILRAAFPEQTSSWGDEPSNDNSPGRQDVDLKNLRIPRNAK